VTASAARFGRFELLARIGAGGGGEVLLVSDGARRLALKRLLPHVDGATAAGAFEREGMLAARLVHPNIVQVLEHGQVDGLPYVLMEYVDGVSLHALLRAAGRLPSGVAALVVRDACRALAYLHELDDGDGRALALVHRDVSPSNLLVSRDGDVKLCDFGITKATATTATRTVPGFTKGKRGYRSPEQESQALLDARSDVWAAGVVLFEALTGRRPRDDGERPSQWVAAVPPLLDDICTRARALEPERRFATAAEMAAALDAVVAAECVRELRAIIERRCPRPPAGEATATRTLARVGGARRWIAATTLAAAAIAIGAVALSRRAPPRESPPALPATTATVVTSPSPSPSRPTPPLPLPGSIAAPAAPVAPTVAVPAAPSRAAPPSRAKHAHRPSPPAARSDYMPDPFHR
jgi:serine/threonine-protein kinase